MKVLELIRSISATGRRLNLFHKKNKNKTKRFSLFKLHLNHIFIKGFTGDMLYMSIKIKSAEAARKSELNSSQIYVQHYSSKKIEHSFATKSTDICCTDISQGIKSSCFISELKCYT